MMGFCANSKAVVVFTEAKYKTVVFALGMKKLKRIGQFVDEFVQARSVGERLLLTRWTHDRSWEVMGIDEDLGFAFVKAFEAAGMRLPKRGKVFISVKNADKRGIVAESRELARLGYELLATEGTYRVLKANSVPVERVNKVHEGRPHIVDLIKNREIDLVLNTPLGKQEREDDDRVLVQDFLDLLEANGCDFTLAFRRLGELPADDDAIKPLFDFPAAFDDWLARWRERCAREPLSDAERHAQMAATNPALIPRNHLVEEAIERGYEGDFTAFHRLADRLERPYEYTPADAELARPPRAEQIVQQTFCGT